MQGAFYTNQYNNMFAQAGYDELEIEQKKNAIFQALFYGPEGVRVYYPIGEDMGYMTDTGNNDVRTEGMSYGMMFCVQMDKKEEFDRIWKWTKTYMYMDSGENKGYFAWSCGLDGTKNSYGPAPDGEEFFAMALFFASNRWGDGEGIFCYSKEAQELLHECIHKGETDGIGESMWERSNHLIKFIPNCDFSDPSYHVPHFYELFALWTLEEDREFFVKAASASRAYLKTACHEVTGLNAEYAEYDGDPLRKTPERPEWMFIDRHDWFYSDSYRLAANIGLDYEWFAKDEWECECAEKIQNFFYDNLETNDYDTYEINGTKLGQKALHPIGLLATNAQASLAAKHNRKMEYVKMFYNTPLRVGERRYYDNCLYFFAFLALSGSYRIWK